MINQGDTLGIFGVLVLVAAYLKCTKESKENVERSREFAKFQNNYILVFLVMMCADWMQGPYVYELYSSYGFDKASIGNLFVAGFGSSAICGPIIGAFADKFGRKRMCIFFGITYGLSCATKHFTDYSTLMVGRVLGGIATSILFSSFEAWMVSQHNNSGFPGVLMGSSFEWAWGWNGGVAVLAGVVTGYAAELYGPVAAFDCSMVMLSIGTIMIMCTWQENYGEVRLNLAETLGSAFVVLKNNTAIVALGFVQSFFEGAMYLFVFMWTPALDGLNPDINHGWIFATFMLSCMIGTEVFHMLKSRVSVEKAVSFVFVVSACATFVVSQFEVYYVRLFCFLIFEMCVGCFWPAISMLRAKYIPDNVRSTVMNLFRVPLNIIVILSLLNIGNMSVSMVFTGCTILHILAFLCCVRLMTSPKEVPSYDTVSVDDNQEVEMGGLKNADA